MTFICEPYVDGIKLTQRIEELSPKKIMLTFWHGWGDILMFLNPLQKLRLTYPHIRFDLGVQKGLTYETVIPNAVSLSDSDNDPLYAEYDLVCKLVFPMNEGQNEYTKGEWGCISEIGIPPVNGHPKLPRFKNKLIAVHYQITCLPDCCNAVESVAEKVWNDIRENGYIPIEVHFQHIFHNPVNAKYGFIDSTVRQSKPEVCNLVGLLQSCAGFVGVVSGPFHTALSIFPPERILLLERAFRKECFTKEPIFTASVENYQGEVKRWLANF